ncbi:hypothetical protein BH11BAC6_BH11BAC6_00760 [soil metagenome]
MKSILCFLFAFSSNFAFASGPTCVSCAFTGTVVDAFTKKPIADVMIVARDAENGDEQKFTTDDQGQYKIPSLPAGNYTIRFEKNNYRSVEKKNLAVKKTSSRINVELVFDDEQEDHHNWLPKYDII